MAMILFVVAFQSYWLWDNYRMQKNGLLKEIENKVQKQALALTLQELAGNIQTTGADSNTNTSFASAIKKDTSVLDDNPQKATKKDLQEYSRLSSISFTLSNPSVLIDDNNHDSALYYFLNKNMPELGGINGNSIVIYNHSQHGFRSYPRNKPFINQNNTLPIAAKLNYGSKFQVHIRHLNLIVLHKMYSTFIFSLCYLLLFAATMFAIIQADKQSKKLLESKTNFTNNMTHELKIPLSTLFLATESLDKYSSHADPKQVQKHVSIIYSGLHQLSDIVDKILATARFQQHQVRLHCQAVNIRSLIEEVLKNMHLQLAQKKATVDISGIPDNAYIYADYEQMLHVIFNLIDNAIKYTTADPLITITLKKHNNKYAILLRDNGKGIPQKYFREVFQPYFRVPEQDMHNVKGYGLGLSFVLHIIRLHSGNIRIVSSEENVGTIIEIKLPVHDV